MKRDKGRGGEGICQPVFFNLTANAVLISPPQSPAGLRGFLRIPAGLPYDFGEFELKERNSVPVTSHTLYYTSLVICNTL
jgi:hypothetical protein